MYPSVVSSFALALKGEGLVPYIYLDKRSLLTTGRGNLIDSSVKGYTDPTTLSWVNASDGSPATADQLMADLNAVKARPDLIPYATSVSPNGDSFASITKLRLTDDAIAGLVAQSAAQLWASLQRYIPGIDSWPADGQLGLLRWAWGNGPNVPFKAPRMYAALTQMGGPDFRTAATEAHWLDENPDTAALIPQLFHNAADVLEHGLDVATLVWPNNVVQGPDGVVATSDSDFSGDAAEFRAMIAGLRSVSMGSDCPPNVGADSGGILGGHSLLDVLSLKREYDKNIANLRSQFSDISACWAGLNPADEGAFAIDLKGLEARWAAAVAKIHTDQGWVAETDAGLNVVFQHRIIADAALGQVDPGVVPAETSYQTLVSAIRQGGSSSAELQPGDYFSLHNRLSEAQRALGVTPTALQTQAETPFVPSMQDTDTQGRKAEQDSFYWIKLGLVAVTAGLLVNAATNAMALRKAVTP